MSDRPAIRALCETCLGILFMPRVSLTRRMIRLKGLTTSSESLSGKEVAGTDWLALRARSSFLWARSGFLCDSIDAADVARW